MEYLVEPSFQVGDRVRLKSGERVLTVKEIYVDRDLSRLNISGGRLQGDDRVFKGNWKCTYETPTGYQTGVFHQDLLEKY